MHIACMSDALWSFIGTGNPGDVDRWASRGTAPAADTFGARKSPLNLILRKRKQNFVSLRQEEGIPRRLGAKEDTARLQGVQIRIYAGKE